jgi:hypothetical protein
MSLRLPLALHPPLLIPGLALVTLGGFGAARWFYPVENSFSVMTCTISFLGSPDANRNPDGWRFYQAGMTAAVLLLAVLACNRAGRFLGRPPALRAAATVAFLAALALVLASAWIPDSRELLWIGQRSGALHNRVAIAGIAVMMAAVSMDALSLTLGRAGGWLLAPHAALAAASGTGLLALRSWRLQCEANPELRYWPGQGIYSTPMWEWIVFSLLWILLLTQARASRRLPRRSASCGD